MADQIAPPRVRKLLMSEKRYAPFNDFTISRARRKSSALVFASREDTLLTDDGGYIID